jgi:hypothetical protein
LKDRSSWETKKSGLGISKKILPKGTREGSWLKFYLELDPEGTEKQRGKAAKLIKKLKDKGRGK